MHTTKNQPTIQEAWEAANAAWKAAGSPLPCYEPAYMAARAVLADAWNRALQGDSSQSVAKKLSPRRW